MEFLKRNLFVIICLLVCLVSIGLGLVACDSFESIRQSMADAAGFGRQLASAGKAGGRSQWIAPPDLVVQEQNKKTMQEAVRVVRDKVLAENRRDMDYLVPDAFPDPTQPALQTAFVRAYRQAVDALPTLLQAKGPPTQEDIKAVEEKIQAENEDMGLGTKRPVSGRRPPPRRAPRRADTARKRARMEALARKIGKRGAVDRRQPPPGGAGRAKAAGEEEPISEEERLRTDPTRRAEIERAQSIRCYVGNNVAETFTVVPEALEFTSNPDPREIWRAQVTLWVQREVCQALAKVNDEAAKALQGAPKADVTALPVKRVIRLAVGDYRSQGAAADKTRGSGGAQRRTTAPPRKPARQRQPARQMPGAPRGRGGPGGGEARGGPAAQAKLDGVLGEPTWTGRSSGQALDVVPVAIRLVLDVRYLPQVIDRICRANYYVPTRVNYRQLKRSELAGPYLYGPEPVVEATLVFERYFFPEIYAEKMPPAVHEWLDHRLAGKDRKKGKARR